MAPAQQRVAVLTKHALTSLTKQALAALLLLAIAPHAASEQKVVFGEFEVHYIVLPTTFLRPEVASRYDLIRGRDRAFINISVLGPDGKPRPAKLAGSSRNLLEQRQTLAFEEVREGPALYYLAQIRHADEEHHRIEIDIILPDGSTQQLALQQKLYWEE